MINHGLRGWARMQREQNPKHPCHPWSDKKQQNKRKENMNNQFDELTKSMAQSVTRRQALRRFGVGLAGVALAMLGLPNSAQAVNACGGCPPGYHCVRRKSLGHVCLPNH
jgi:hypothetical protein